MAQCVTEATATLYGQTVVTPTAQLSTSIREEVTTVVEPNSFVWTSSCQGGGVPEVSATTENTACSTWSYPVVTTRTVTSTVTDVATLDGPGSPFTSSFPTETQYKTSCETVKNNPTPTIIATPVLVATTIYSVSVSSTEVPVTVANGEVSVSLLLQTISLLVTATATITQNVTVTPVPISSSSTPVAAIAGAAAGGAIALTAIVVGLLFFLRRKKKRRVVAASDEDEDGRYGAIGADGFPVAGKGGSVKKKRHDLVDSEGNDSNPGPIEPFTYTSPSVAVAAVPVFEPLPRSQAYSPLPQGPNAAASASPPPTSPNGSSLGHFTYFPLGANSPPPPGSPPATTSSRETKPSEAQRRRTMGGSSGVASSSSSTTAGWAGSRFDEDTTRSPGEGQMSPILVHQDAGPVPEELPPVYANRGGADT